MQQSEDQHSWSQVSSEHLSQIRVAGQDPAAPSALLPSSPSIILESGWLGRSLPYCQLWQLWTSGFQTFSPLLQTVWLLVHLHSRPRGGRPLLAYPHLNAWPGTFAGTHIQPLLWCVSVCHFCSVPFTFFWLPSLVRAKVSSNFWGGHLPPASHPGNL